MSRIEMVASRINIFLNWGVKSCKFRFWTSTLLHLMLDGISLLIGIASDGKTCDHNRPNIAKGIISTSVRDLYP